MGHVAQTGQLGDAEQYARSLFMDEPGLSIDEAARMVNEHCRRSLVKPVISRIRQEVRTQIANGHQKTVVPAYTANRSPFVKVEKRWTPPAAIHPVVRKAEAAPPFNPPKFTQEVLKASVMVPTPSPTQMASSDRAPIQAPKVEAPPVLSNKLERSRFLSDWAEKNPNATIANARQALMDKFGTAMGTAYISETLKLARQMAGLDPKPQEKERPPATAPVLLPKRTDVAMSEAVQVLAKVAASATIQSVIADMKHLGLRKVEFKADGTVGFEMAV